MKRFDIKVKNTFDYWSDFEGESSVYGFIKWDSKEAIEIFLDKIVLFAWNYKCLSDKFGIATSVKPLKSIDCIEADYKLYKDRFDDIRYHNPLTLMHTYNNTWVFPSILFTNIKERAEIIVSIDPIIKLEELKDSQCACAPIKIALDIGLNGIQLYYYIDNDIFNLWIDNKKTKRDPEIGGKNLWVDNSELAYLNTPRLNSFLRDLKKLCFEYGATGFEFENLGLNDFCEDGVMFNGEVIYYEDVVDLLLPEHRIVK
jgi:hypothetical protein